MGCSYESISFVFVRRSVFRLGHIVQFPLVIPRASPPDHDSDAITSFDTSSLLISPRFRICPELGALSRGLAASAFRKASCNVRTLMA